MKDTEPGVSYAFVPVYTCCALVFCRKCCYCVARQGDFSRQSSIFKKQKVAVETAYSILGRGRSVE